MEKYCKGCGNPLNHGASFCGKCGTPAAEVISANTTPAQLRPRKKNAPADNSRHNLLYVVLAVVLLLQMVVVAFYGWPGWAVNGKSISGEVLESAGFTLQEGQTAVKTDSGVTMDFGCLLEPGEKIAVEKVKPAAADKDERRLGCGKE